jgi:hypothetical protein
MSTFNRQQGTKQVERRRGRLKHSFGRHYLNATSTAGIVTMRCWWHYICQQVQLQRKETQGHTPRE